MKKQCRVCGVEYDSCYSCEKINSWRTLTDTADHYYILCVVMDYMSDHDAKKAYNALARRGINLREKSKYLPSIRKAMMEIEAKGAPKPFIPVEVKPAVIEVDEIAEEVSN